MDRLPWEDHLAYLDGLPDILIREDHAERPGQKDGQPCAQHLRHRKAERHAGDQVGEADGCGRHVASAR
jgi:hypothetical protein